MELIDKVIYCIYENIPKTNIKPSPDIYVKAIINNTNLPSSIVNIAINDYMIGKWLINKQVNNYIDCLSILLDIAVIRRANNKFINDIKTLITNLQKVDRNSKEEKVILMLFFTKCENKKEVD